MNGNAADQQTLLGSSIRLADTYQSVTRSLKYVLLFLGLVFLTYFVFEATSGKRVHPAQYILVGTAQIIFFLLLLSLAEKLDFYFAFLLAGGGTVTLLSTNARWKFSSRSQGARALAIFSFAVRIGIDGQCPMINFIENRIHRRPSCRRVDLEA